MSVPLEHDYIGLSEPSSMERSSEKILPSSSSSSCSAEAEKKNKTGLHLKATELRLGLPGFGKDLEENTKNGFPLSPMKNSVSGAKRGFSDAIDGSGKWVFGGSEGSGMYSPRCGVNGGLDSNNKTQSVKDAPQTQNNKQQPAVEEKKNCSSAPAAKAQVVGWPPIRSYRKNTMASNLSKTSIDVNVEANQGSGCLYVKVSMDGAPYLRKVDLKIYHNYAELSSALEKMFSCFTLGQCTSHGISESRLKDLLHGSECVLTYEDKDGDWMLVGDVPWEMFIDSCRRLRIMKGSEAIGLAPRAMEKCKSRN